MTIPTKILRLRSSFVYDDSDTELHLTLPITPWMPSAMSIGGDIESDAGVRSSFIICQRETLGLTLRFWEDQWKDVQKWIETVQSGMPFSWIPDPTYRNYPDYTDIVLEGPAVGTKYAATPDPNFPRVLQLPIVLGRLGCTLFNMKEIPPPPQFAIFSDDGRLVVTQVNGAVDLLFTAVGGGAHGNENGGGGGGVSYGSFHARVGTIFAHVGKGSYATMDGHGQDSTINFPVPGGGSTTVGGQGGNPAFGDFGGTSGAGTSPPGPTGSYAGGGGSGVGFAGTPPDFADEYSAGSGGGGGGSGGPGTDSRTIGTHSTAGDGGPPTGTFHGAHGGGGGGTSSATGLGSATDGRDGGGSGQGGHGGHDGIDGIVIVEWQLGEIVATQEI